MANMSAASIEKDLAVNLCRNAWISTSYSSSKDTPETVAEIRKNNAAREAFCK